MKDVERLQKRLERERQGRKQAEAIAEEQKRELYQANLELQRLNAKLEKRVQRRTAELSAARDETLQSIKARSAAEGALLAAQGRLTHLLTSSRVVIFSLEAKDDHRRTFISENLREFIGFEFLAELRNNQQHRKIPVVVVTGADLTEEDHRNLNGGAERILSKSSYSRDELFEEVRALVAQYIQRDSDHSETASHD